MHSDRSIPWLLVENDDDDFLLAERAFRRAGASVTLYRAKDGLQARLLLLAEGCFADRETYPLPALILSDLKMPGLDGLEFLAWVREQGLEIPFILLTSSSSAIDRDRAHALRVSEYLVKPSRFADLQELVQSLIVRYAPPV